MEFFKCSIGGEIYGTGITEIERGVAQQTGMKIPEVCFILFFSEKNIWCQDHDMSNVIIPCTGGKVCQGSAWKRV